ncbi:MAG: hypothetical protein Q7S37_02985 [bacterium]|nr:hypothetical protein [bacterium]
MSDDKLPNGAWWGIPNQVLCFNVQKVPASWFISELYKLNNPMLIRSRVVLIQTDETRYEGLNPAEVTYIGGDPEQTTFFSIRVVCIGVRKNLENRKKVIICYRFSSDPGLELLQEKRLRDKLAELQDACTKNAKIVPPSTATYGVLPGIIEQLVTDN